jgi:tripeptide aminopeptidase
LSVVTPRTSRRLLRDIEALAAIPAPTFAEDERLRWIEERLAGAAGRRRWDRVGNLIWSWGGGAPRLLVAAHVDTVFPSSTRLRIERRNGRLIGPGVGDNAAAVAVAIGVHERLLADRSLAPGAVAFTVGEEGVGNLRGALAVCSELRPGAVVALEGHGLDEVVVDAVGSIRARVAVDGPGGHPWVNRGRPSAIHALVDAAATLLRHSTAAAPVNVGRVSGGQTVNSLADHAELEVEVRATDERRLDRFWQLLSALRVDRPLALSVELLGRRPSGRLRRDSRLLRTVQAVRSELRLPTALASGSTDANAALASGIPALSLGVSRGEDMHTVREQIEIDSLAVGWQQLERVVERLLSDP